MPQMFTEFKRSFVLSLVAFLCVTTASASSASYKVLFPFSGSNGLEPVAGLIFDAAGNAYGTTQGGGPYGKGEVYQLSPTSGFHIIYAFHGGDGHGPKGNLTMDAQGNLYGTTYAGGGSRTCIGGCGTVFKLAPPVNNGHWTETVLYSFSGGNDGAYPWAGIAIDQAGNLYGTTQHGGTFDQGVIFQLTPTPSGWTDTVLHNFACCDDGALPQGGMIADAFGNLFGMATYGGPENCGIVFELTSQDGSWTYTVIYTFGINAGDGTTPTGGLIEDDMGTLYGTTAAGGINKCGGAGGCGTVFELTQNLGGWQETILHNFDGSDGEGPAASLTLDAKGNLYGSTSSGGGAGNIFELRKPSPGQEWTERFFSLPSDGHLGLFPESSLSFDSAGRLYGTTFAGGSNGSDGVIFRIAP